ncbi:hypothetical protein A0H81_01916 [Grifola frondosa]|uniref:DUF6532 domain-containing protein n=1 Tax=Grifola frondosa TaxID=5627 RepID=A0A1C7MKZ8_GRIFR|nr:hypothetical protein A0H81_01916 [Grifola frondosa]
MPTAHADHALIQNMRPDVPPRERADSATQNQPEASNEDDLSLEDYNRQQGWDDNEDNDFEAPATSCASEDSPAFTANMHPGLGTKCSASAAINFPMVPTSLVPSSYLASLPHNRPQGSLVPNSLTQISDSVVDSRHIETARLSQKRPNPDEQREEARRAKKAMHNNNRPRLRNFAHDNELKKAIIKATQLVKVYCITINAYLETDEKEIMLREKFQDALEIQYGDRTQFPFTAEIERFLSDQESTVRSRLKQIVLDAIGSHFGIIRDVSYAAQNKARILALLDYEATKPEPTFHRANPQVDEKLFRHPIIAELVHKAWLLRSFSQQFITALASGKPVSSSRMISLLEGPLRKPWVLLRKKMFKQGLDGCGAVHECRVIPVIEPVSQARLERELADLNAELGAELALGEDTDHDEN